MRVRLVRIVKHLIRQACLDHLTALHHHDSMRQQPGHREIMRYNHDCKPEFVDQSAHKIEQSRLNGNIEPSSRLIHEDKTRFGNEVAGNLKPLPHAAGIGLRRIIDPIGRNLDTLQP